MYNYDSNLITGKKYKTKTTLSNILKTHLIYFKLLIQV